MASEHFRHGEGSDIAMASEGEATTVADPMDLDFDFDLEGLPWANELNHSLGDIGSELGLSYHEAHGNQQSTFESSTGFPLDLLFLEDEGTLPGSTVSGLSQVTNSLPAIETSRPVMLSAGHMHAGGLHGPDTDDPGAQRLRNQLELLSGGSCGDQLMFKDCEPSKAIALHSMAMEFGLNYGHDANSCTVTISRIQTGIEPPNRHIQQPAQPLDSGFWTSDAHMAAVNGSFVAHVVNVAPADSGPDSSLYDRFIQDPLSQHIDQHFTGFELVETYAPTASPATVRGALSNAIKTSSKATGGPDQLDGTIGLLHSRAVDQTNDYEEIFRQPSRSERIGRSISKHVSTWKTSIAKGGRRGPLTSDGRRDMKALEAAGGACWRCKVLKRKCDPGFTCRCCLQSVTPAQLGEDAPLWPMIGCRRGKLRDSMLEQVLCPKSRGQRRSQESERCGSFRSRRSVDAAGKYLLAAESQRLADMKAVLECASYKISIGDPDMRDSFASFVEAGRYRNQECLHRTHYFQDTTVTYADLIATIAWELASNQSVLPLLEIRSWKAFMSMLETACIYEAEVGQTSLVMISMICLQHCLQALRLNSANLLSANAHEDCVSSQCQVHYIRDLLLSGGTYIDELSAVIFNKDNMRDRRWWLSTFYSLYIQSYVRHALIAIEKQLCFPSADDTPAEDFTSTQYLHLAAVLFTAASAKYDPLLGGRHQYALTDNSVIPETSIPDSHHSSVRAVCEVDQWSEAGIRSSYQFLRRLLQIGSLDFETEQAEHPLICDLQTNTTAPVGSPQGPVNDGLSSPVFRNADASVSSGLESPRELISPFPQPYSIRSSHRTSWNSGYSGPSFASISNPSEESLAKTFITDITSIYEMAIPAVASPSDAQSISDVASFLTPEVVSPTSAASGGFAASTSYSGITSPLVASAPVAPNNGSFLCDCCPKAPRSFNSVDELRQHESEKPHACSQPECKMRFKSPKEADRHINALHLKSDYWTCDAISTPLHAFYSETSAGLTCDICGFCGGGISRKDDEAGMDELLKHLDSMHKFGECNRERKFYRVDNFRQHLKTAHLAKPGKWLKILERNCRTVTTGES
ncbi:hypothetical protein B0H66DRAFT_587054 [Apodospora peruviana]|uniref:C2H2-type zinc finger ascomycetes domain-containing protein n=1 Tax=Apodospora peruviana TaxID=516989 RepID=A0AAE0IT88_9PEZI|nr:hypothetical protein B0H66DRAFT_587054 [Apodospora peruviana]